MTDLPSFNSLLRRATGYELKRTRGASVLNPEGVIHRPPANPEIDRLLRKPVFIISPVRSGSTLLRVLLNGHSRLHAPHELHLPRLNVTAATPLAEKSMKLLDLEVPDLEHLLWDRVLHRELQRSGKDFIVEKTPANAFLWKRLAACWPDARFVFLLRHPASIAASWYDADPKNRTLEGSAALTVKYMKAVEQARRGLPGITVRYEELTADPKSTLADICEFLDVEFEPTMVDYRPPPRKDLRRGLGDWRGKIRSGRIQPGRELPAAASIPPVLLPVCRSWGYVDSPAEGGGQPAPPGS